MNTKLIFVAVSLLFASSTMAQAVPSFKVEKTYHIASAGGWDYIAVGPDNNLYISHGTQVNILNKKTGDSTGIILNTPGVHGIAFDVASGKGFTSNGKGNSVTVFDIKTKDVLSSIPVGENPDAIMYEEFSKKILTCNGKSKDLNVIDPLSYKVVATIPVGGKPETAVSDDAGKVYVNIEDNNEIVVINMADYKVEKHISLAPGESPTGLAIDKTTKRLFAGCDKLLVVINTENGKIVDKITIGDGCDGVVFDPGTRNIFTSNGEGTLSVIHEAGADKYEFKGNLLTKKSARTLALDETTHTVYLPAADMEPAQAGQRSKMIPGTFQVLVVTGK